MCVYDVPFGFRGFWESSRLNSFTATSPFNHRKAYVSRKVGAYILPLRMGEIPFFFFQIQIQKKERKKKSVDF